MHGKLFIYLIWLFLGYKLKNLLSFLTSPFNLSEFNIPCKKFFLNLEPNFWAGTRKNYCTVIFYISTHKFFQTQNFVFELKILKFGAKIAVIGYFGLEFQNTNVAFEISIIEFVNMQRFIQNQKTLNL